MLFTELSRKCHYMNSIPPNPMIQPWITAATEDNTVVIRHADRAVVFTGPGAKALMPELIAKLDGTSQVDAIINSFPAEKQAAISSAIDLLAHHNLLIEGTALPHTKNTPAPGLRNAASLAELLSPAITIDEIASRLSATHLHILTDLSNISHLKNILVESGFGFVETFPLSAVTEVERSLTQNSVVVVAPKLSSARELRQMNDIALEIGCRWTHILPYDGSYAIVGPLYIPGETGCYRCLQLRRRSTIEAADQQRIVDDDPDSILPTPIDEWTSPGQEVALWGLFAHLLSIECLRLYWAPAPLAGHIHTMEWKGNTVNTVRHRLFRVPRCPSCGPTDLGVPQPWFEAPATAAKKN